MNDPYAILQEIIENKHSLTEGEKIKLQYYLTHCYLKKSSELSWKPLPEPFSKYSISSDGRIRSYRFYNKTNKPHYIYPSVDFRSGNGTYYTLRLPNNVEKIDAKKGVKTDRLIAWTFLKIPIDQIKRIDYIDNNPFNVVPENLQVVLK